MQGDAGLSKTSITYKRGPSMGTEKKSAEWGIMTVLNIIRIIGDQVVVGGRGRRRRRLWVLACGGVVLASHSIVHYYNQLLF